MNIVRRRWRDYRTQAGGRPVRDFLLSLPLDERAEVLAAMREVSKVGVIIARHLRGDVYEVRASSATRSFRILFASEGRRAQVLLSLSGFIKKTQKTPRGELELAERRLADWRARAKLPSHSVGAMAPKP